MESHLLQQKIGNAACSLILQMDALLGKFNELLGEAREASKKQGPTAELVRRVRRAIVEFDALWPFWKEEAARSGVDTHNVEQLEAVIQWLKCNVNYRYDVAHLN